MVDMTILSVIARVFAVVMFVVPFATFDDIIAAAGDVVVDVAVTVADVAAVMAPVRRDLNPENETDDSDEKDDGEECADEEEDVEEELLLLVAAGVVKVESDAADSCCCTTPLSFVGNGYDPVGIAKVLSRSRKTFFHTNGSIAIQYHCRDTYYFFFVRALAANKKLVGSIVTPLLS
jgi:hypothetical protein